MIRWMMSTAIIQWSWNHFSRFFSSTSVNYQLT